LISLCFVNTFFALPILSIIHGFINFFDMENPGNTVKTKQQMADEYGVCRKTFNKLLEKKNISINRGLITPRDQMNIYNELGIPGVIKLYPSITKSSR
jgi:hypothetical protein